MNKWIVTCNNCGAKSTELLAWGGVECKDCGQTGQKDPGLTFQSPEYKEPQNE